jgi:hypothetical protein
MPVFAAIANAGIFSSGLAHKSEQDRMHSTFFPHFLKNHRAAC